MHADLPVLYFISLCIDMQQTLHGSGQASGYMLIFTCSLPVGVGRLGIHQLADSAAAQSKRVDCGMVLQKVENTTWQIGQDATDSLYVDRSNI